MANNSEFNELLHAKLQAYREQFSEIEAKKNVWNSKFAAMLTQDLTKFISEAGFHNSAQAYSESTGVGTVVTFNFLLPTAKASDDRNENIELGRQLKFVPFKNGRIGIRVITGGDPTHKNKTEYEFHNPIEIESLKFVSDQLALFLDTVTAWDAQE